MKVDQFRSLSILGGLAAVIAVFSASPKVQANVFASNIKLNGALSSVTNNPGTSVSISYILNEPATLGTTINILSGTNVINTISITAGSAGALMGTNIVVWGGTNSNGSVASGGIFSVSITAAASGYTNWTQITSDTNAGNYIYWPAGMAVDCNTNSLYYGRIMVCNSGPGITGTNIGDTNGVVKLNADGSYADEGQGTAGYDFTSDNFPGDIPRRGRIAADDRFYFNDWTGNGKIVAVDMLMASNQVILDSANFTGPAASGNFSEIDVTDVGTTNALAWFADFNVSGVGVYAWPITNGGAADPANTTGTKIVARGGTDIPQRAVFGLMIDANQDIFIGNVQTGSGDSVPRVTCITNWPSSPHQPLTNDNVFWAAGAGDGTFDDICDLAIDSRAKPKFVACALSGASSAPGGMRILNATNGSLVTNLQQNSTVFFISAAWDNVGNVYGGIDSHFWRAFSPPGTNQATTVAVETIQVSPPLTITGISTSGGTVTINFTGDPAGAFTLLSSATVNPASSYTTAVGASIIQVSPGSFQATVPVSGTQQYYRIKQ